MTSRTHIARSCHKRQPYLVGLRLLCALPAQSRLSLVCLLLALLAGASPYALAASGLQEIRYWSLGEVTRVVIQIEGDFSYRWNRLEDPPRAFFDLPNVDLVLVKNARDRGRIRIIEVNDPILRQIRYAENSPGVARVVLDLNESCTITPSQLANPARLVIELRTKKPTSPDVVVSRSGVVDAATALEDARDSETDSQTFDTPTAPARPAQTSVDVPVVTSGSGPSLPAPIATPIPIVTTPADAVPAPAVSTAQSSPPAEQPTLAASPPSQSVPPTGGQPDSTVPASTVATVAANQALTALGVSEAPPAEMPTVSTESLPAPESSPPQGTAPAPTAAPAIPEGDTAGATAPAADGSPEIALAKPATRTVNGRQSLVRALGLKIGKVVIDPGHGGKDHGTTGVSGLKEKDLVLDISKRLADLIRERLGAEVVLTREQDVFVPLEERTAIANQHRADLFVSVHANSSPYKLASGAETFFLNFTSSREAMDVAARENASAQRSVGELQDIVRRIALKDKRDESEDFAARVQKALYVKQRNEGLAVKNRGVKAAPFIVLVGAEMPSILVELGFLSNAKEEAALKTPAYRQKLAEALAEGLETYMDSLSHLEVTERAAARQEQ